MLAYEHVFAPRRRRHRGALRSARTGRTLDLFAAPCERERVTRSVCRVNALIKLYLDEIESLGVAARTVEPVQAAKWDAETCPRLTGYAGRSNQHGRDALRLVFGRSLPFFPDAMRPPIASALLARAQPMSSGR